MRRIAVLLALTAATAVAAAVPLSAGTATIQLALSASSVEYADTIVASGSVAQAGEGDEIVVELLSDGVLRRLGTAALGPDGAFSVELPAVAGGLVQARDPTSGTVSEPVALEVRPRVDVRATRGKAFHGAVLHIRVAPLDYRSPILALVSIDNQLVGTARGKARHGSLTLRVPTPGVGRFTVAVSLPAGDGLAGRLVTTAVRATGRALAVGAGGPDVAGVVKALARLHFRVPPGTRTFTWELLDSVYAFQKAYRLPLTGVVDARTWQKLAHARPLKPRFRGPAAHIEVDKTRQILLDVRGGAVAAVIPVSTGATGNTPEGKHEIRWKALSTTTWLGPAILYRTMTFVGNSFAIHGFPSVPPYPASHGCVRIPIWTADWLYQRSSVGETVYVYR